ncbi:MAG: hypothetical protein LC658_04960, partial [Bacteroidales bacterium]|nr:hypothetical protein [Bacteroidales bacterium]
PKAKDLKLQNKSTAIFEFLLQEIKPKIIFVHGSKAIRYIEKLTSTILRKNEEHEVILFGNKTTIIAGNHLSRGWSFEKATKLGNLLKKILKD